MNDRILKETKSSFDELKLTVDWTDFNGYFARVEKNRSAINLGSYVGAATAVEYVVGFDNREPTPDELNQMKQLVRTAMQQGAMGVSSALEYMPAMFAKTPELIELAKASAEFGGIYSSHIRNEQEKVIEAVLEAADIALWRQNPGRDLAPEGQPETQLGKDAGSGADHSTTTE